MEKLVAGLRKFQADLSGETRAMFERLASGGQSPEVLFITCSDSRVVPNLVTNTDPGDLFVVRNAGNIIPAWPAVGSGEAATIEYAVSVLGVKDIVVCGHTHCGAMQAVLNPQLTKGSPAIQAWLRNAEATAQVIRDHYPDLPVERASVVAAEENVLVQLANLRTYPSVATRMRTGQITLHGWVYKIETSQVFQYDPTVTQFVDLARDALAAAE